ncbi:uncharacterized protein LOC128557336 [Mercenaria mercenaria]|uniref:uncharacterized protein LOC128557336 n=1 Tax=Mercenaria mercenaria TaxID=6596 RepID=UPI00234ECC55|nr:uncharacterized protein LOC128557336 [Mercenaria mercenaria]
MKRKMLMRVVILSSILVKLISGFCTWPDPFANTVYDDSSKGEITFQTDTLTGWTIKIGTHEYDTWRCHSTALYESDNILVMITESTFPAFGKQFYGFICLKLTEITQSSYRYYLNYREEPNVDNERVAMSEESNREDWDNLCMLDDRYASYLPAESEYRVMLRSDSVASAKIGCPYVFFGSYEYTHTSSDGTVTCESSSGSLSTCTESTEISFDYNSCSTKVAYSVSDSVWCVDTVPSGGTNYITVYNGYDADSDIDNTNVYRFTCIAISADGTMVSIAPNSCRKDQTPDAVPTQNGANIGSTLTLTKTAESCRMYI